MNEYSLTKKCKACGNEYNVKLTKYEAAFDPLSSKIMKTAECPVCKSEEYASASINMPDIDEDTMQKWAADSDLYFLQQDEDLMIADQKYIPLIEYFIQQDNILPEKRNILITALCVMVYDKSEGYKQALEILSKHKELLEAARSYMYAYIGKKVYPLLGIKW